MSRCCDPRLLRRGWFALALGCLVLLLAAPSAWAVRSGSGGAAAKPKTGPKKHGGHGEVLPENKSKGKPKPGKGAEELEEEALEAGGVEEEGTAAKDLGTDGQVDPISGLGIRNPVCDDLSQIRSRSTRLSCETTGTPQSNYPTGNYGFDIHIKTGLTHPVGTASYVFATILSGIWMGLANVLHLILAVLGLAFGMNPFGNGETMGEITRVLGRMYNRITDPWLSTLIVCGGIWFAYKSLLKREVGAGVSGTILAVAMLVIGLWVVHEPRQSVGRLAKISDEVALGVISAPQTGSAARPMGGYAEAMSATWSRLMEVPFAGLDFSDVRWAMSKPPPDAVQKADEKFCEDTGALALLAVLSELGSDEAKAACAAYAHKRYGHPRRVIDLYLRSSPSSPSREALWDFFDDNDEYKAKVAAQGGDGVLTRLSMLALFAIGLLGSILLLAWLSIRLFTQAVIAFVLLLIAPFALFFPMLGDSGRRAFKAWGLALLGALVAKVIYAMFLSVVLLGITILGKANGPAGSATGFLLSCVFTWAVLLKRMEIIGWMSIGDGESGRGHGLGLGHYHAMQWGERIASAPFRTMRGLGRRGGQWRRVRRAERAQGTRETAGSSLRDSARRLGNERYEQAEATVAAWEGGGGYQARRKGGGGGGGGAPSGGGDQPKGGGGSGGAGGIKDQMRGFVHAAMPKTTVGRAPAVPGSSGTAATGSRGGAAPLNEEQYMDAKELLARAKDNERKRGERWSPSDLDGFEKHNRQLLASSENPADHAHRVKGLGRSKFEGLEGAKREEAEEQIKQARKRDAKREKVSTELPGRVFGRAAQKGEAMRQHREGSPWSNERRQHIGRLRRERISGKRHRDGLSRGG